MHKKLDPLKDNLSLVELVRISGNDLDIVNAARVCYGHQSETITDRDEKLIKYLLVNKHTSPFEHNQISFKIKAPLFVVRQWMRHRVGVSYNEISGRYSVSPLDFYVPQKLRTPDAVNKQGSNAAELKNEKELLAQYKKTIESSANTYKELLENGVARELARCVLPLCTYTEFIFTCNLVSLMHFLSLRLDKHAQWEIQQYSQSMLDLAKPHFPVSLALYEELKINNQI
ncbi:TPA: FAD-dependent thymidylate synthase [Candidatus Dependentiae bacterium]|nr:MAG: Thymidylate synthase ThyX [candidate division TM6 bacterium GW2011_GWE2_31_21]KKP53723.1 MAG: Thymidylate synthase ThyX [candidate division TM6 bacterium GW2011_GWF2_33_332]HBS48525.1 FAD-dependent thymidylate synthase [Candidatus Dependentiae bacterium]HBZ73140.1 FAD-dependent thymidylate synthase [Candidatus Dependentiae bacterium]